MLRNWLKELMKKIAGFLDKNLDEANPAYKQANICSSANFRPLHSLRTPTEQ